jgi:hypothetical protein
VLHVGAYFNQDQARVEGPSSEYVRVGASGGKPRFYFCSTYGSTMFFDADVRSGSSVFQLERSLIQNSPSLAFRSGKRTCTTRSSGGHRANTVP